MIIDGRLIASDIKTSLKQKVSKLIQRGVTPQLAVILVGDDPGSAAYVKAKRKAGKETGIKFSIFNFQFSNKREITNLVMKLNNKPLVHGIIVQRPIPVQIEKDELDKMVAPEKDVDGFHPNTRFDPPVAMAVDKILQWVSHDVCNNPDSPLKQPYCEPYINWLKKQKILVIGRGETAGKPIAEYLLKKRINITIAHSKTENMEGLCKSSQIIISCVGKSNIVRHSMVIKKNVLIGVGLHSEEGKLKTDYYPQDIQDTVAYYTPVPGGVGPVNVACLMENVVAAAY